MTKTYTPCSAPGVPPLLYIYDRVNALLFDPWIITTQAEGLQYGSMVPGGYESCSFTIPLAVGKDMMTKAAYRLAVRCGFKTAWEGRIADLTRKTVGGGTIAVLALGGWEHLKQRYITDAAATAETGKTLVERILAEMPLISTDHTDIGDPGFDLTDQSWTRQTAQKIINDVAKLGDDQTPPRTWYFNVWDTDDLTLTGSYAGMIATSARDAYDTGGAYDGTATTLRIGYGSASTYTAGFIFPALGIARYTKILTATMNVQSAGELGADDPCAITIYCERSGAPADFSASVKPSGRTKSVAHEHWTPLYPDLGGWPAVAGTVVTTDDFTPVVQEIVNMDTWSSDSGLDIILAGENQSPNDTRKQIRSYDNAASTAASLAITYGLSDETTMAFHSEFVPRQSTAAASDADYLIFADDVEGGFEVTPSLEECINYVVAKYASSYTAAAEDGPSQDTYDRRENNPDDLNAGTSAGSAQAINLRDTYLEEHKDPKWKANDITVKRLYNRWGWPVNPAAVRAGCVIRLMDFPTFETDVERAYFVIRTRYSADSGTLTLSPELQQDTLEIQLLRVKQESEA